jgi:hypothetical protein
MVTASSDQCFLLRSTCGFPVRRRRGQAPI